MAGPQGLWGVWLGLQPDGRQLLTARLNQSLREDP